MKVLIIVAAFLLVQVYGNVINAKCDPQLFSTCTDAFARALGLPAMPSDASVLENQIKQLEAKGKQGQAQVCKAGGDLETCLGQEYSDCMTVAFLKSIGVSDKDAKEFVKISQEMHKTCTQVSFEINDKCEQELFTKCTDTFAKALGLPSMPSDASVLDKQIKQIEAKGKQGQEQVCKAQGNLRRCLGQQYHDCISVAYLKSIGESDADAKEFVAISKQLEHLCAHVFENVMNAKCEQQLFTKCTDTFAKALGLPSMPTDANILNKQLQQIEAKGKEGQEQVCKAATALQACLGQEYQDCLSVQFLKSIGESEADAELFVLISQQLEILCAQVQTNVINAKCEQQLFTQCTNAFARDLGLPSMPSDPSVLENQIKKLEARGKQGQAQVCKAGKNLATCLGQEYSDCISVAYLKSIGVSDKDAKEFVAISHEMHETCTQVSFEINAAKCEQQLFTQCTNAFARDLGLPSMPSDASVLENQIKKLEAKGKQGQAQVCKAGKNLETCLGQEYSDCISVAYLKSIGVSDKDAKEFVAISHEMHKTCTQVIFEINDQCEQELFTKCTNNFARALGLPSMPSDASVLDKQIKQIEAKGKQGQIQVCKAAEHLQGCLGSQYDSCISVAYLKSIGESDADAKEFVAISQQLKKMCVQ